MISLRNSKDRGHFDFGWLNTYHTFSFGDYHDKNHMGFRSLRVINEDYVKPNEGFPTHGHRDMEIITYIVEGALEHKDSMGTGSVIVPGDVQSMSAGSGVTHSEFNHSKNELVHLLQIWILPAKKGGQPGYEQKTFQTPSKSNKLLLVASQDGREGSVTVHQDISLYASVLSEATDLSHSLKKGRGVWIQVVTGALSVNGQSLNAGDGAAIEDEDKLNLHALQNCEFLLFDLGH